MSLMLRNPDLTTARRVAEVINAHLHDSSARAIDPSTVALTFPDKARSDVVGFLTDIEQLDVEPDEVARVVIDEANGIIVMGESVRISTVAVAQGNLTVRVTETPQVSQPNPFSAAGTTAPHRRPPTASRETQGRGGVQFAPSAARRPWWCRAPMSRSTSRAIAAWPCCLPASACASWSTG